MEIGFWLLLSLLLIAVFLLIAAWGRINLLMSARDELSGEKNALQLKNVELASSLNSSSENTS